MVQPAADVGDSSNQGSVEDTIAVLKGISASVYNDSGIDLVSPIDTQIQATSTNNNNAIIGGVVGESSSFKVSSLSGLSMHPISYDAIHRVFDHGNDFRSQYHRVKESDGCQVASYLSLSSQPSSFSCIETGSRDRIIRPSTLSI